MAGDMDQQRFEAAMAAVKRHFDNEEFEQALPLVMKALDFNPDHPVVRRSRIYALLNLSMWQDALKVCDNQKGDGEDTSFERAYCLYRLNRFQESLEILNGARKGQNDPEEIARQARLEAQVRYRMADYQACADMYEKLSKDDPEDTGLLVNAVASHVSGDRPNKALSLLNKNEELLESSYELCFNFSCALIDGGRLQEAEERLNQAKDICVQELLQAEDIDAEDASLLE
ncbi:unnamed protein product, partial [Polarella glacialis]